MLAEKWGLSADSPDLSWFIPLAVVNTRHSSLILLKSACGYWTVIVIEVGSNREATPGETRGVQTGVSYRPPPA